MLRKLSLSRISSLVTIVAALALGLAGTAQAATRESIVLFDRGLSGAAERALVSSVAGQVTRQLHIIDALGARLTPAQANALTANPHVISVRRRAR